MLSPVLLERLRMVEARPRPGQDSPSWLVVTRHGSDRSRDGTATQPGRPPGRGHGRPGQASDAARPAPQLCHPSAGSRRSASASFRFCWATRSLRPRPCMPLWPTDLLRSVISPLDQTSGKPQPE